MKIEELPELLLRMGEEIKSLRGDLSVHADFNDSYYNYTESLISAAKEAARDVADHSFGDATIITDEDVYWEMTWSQDRHPDKPPIEIMFDHGQALARLLAEDVLFTNSFYWEKEWPEAARNKAGLFVNCNDIFAWACSDAERLPYDGIQSLYDMWLEDKSWGPAKWCAIQRNQKPQGPVIDAMKKAGVWDERMKALGNNTLDAEIQARFASAKAQLNGE